MNTAASLMWETIGGAAITALVLIDVFLTVLYARIGYSVFSQRVARSTWWLFRQLSRCSGQSKGRVLSFAGPAILVLLVAGWAFGLSAGAALVVHERLGRSIVAQSGKSDKDWVTAFFVGNASLSIVSSSGYSPNTPATRLLYVVNSIIGASVLSLSLTYLMQVYSALNQRNALALSIHLSSGEKGDAAELIIGIAPRGRFEAASRTLDEMSREMVQMKESHHLYSVLFYFRFDDAFYALSRFTFVALDAASLLRTALAPEYDWVKESGSVQSLARSAQMLLATLTENFVGRDVQPTEPDAAERERWYQRFDRARRKFQQAGIEVRSDVGPAADEYVRFRKEWNCYIRRLAPFMAYRIEEIDRVSSQQES